MSDTKRVVVRSPLGQVYNFPTDKSDLKAALNEWGDREDLEIAFGFFNAWTAQFEGGSERIYFDVF